MNIRRYVGLSLMWAGLMLGTGQVWADSWKNDVSSRVSFEHDSNPAMSSANSVGVWRTLFEPSYTLAGNMGRDDLRAGLAMQIARSSNKALSPNQDGPRAFLEWLRHSETGAFGISSRYEKIATRNAGIDSTGSVPVGSTRASRTLGGTLNQAVSERSTIIVDGAYEKVAYQGGPYVDYTTRSGGVRLNYAWSEGNTPFLKLSGVRFTPEGGGTPSSLANAALGWIWKVEYMDVSMQFGKSRASGKNSEWEGSFATQYAGQRNQLTLGADRMLMPSGLGSFVKVDQVRGSWIYDLSEYYKTGLDLVNWNNRSIPVNNVRTTTGIWLQREINPLWSLRTYYSHINTKGGGAGAYSNIVGLSVIYANPDF